MHDCSVTINQARLLTTSGGAICSGLRQLEDMMILTEN